MNRSLVVLVLASGSGTRFAASGGIGSKLEAIVQGHSVLQHTISAVRKAGLACHVVTGVEGGMGASIAAGVNATSNAAGWLILPGDLPLIAPQSIQAIAARLDEWLSVVPSWNGQPGHPVAFRHECLESLRQLNGPSGASSVLKSLRVLNRILDLPLEDQGICLDVDTVDDLLLVGRLMKERSGAGLPLNSRPIPSRPR